MTFRKRFILLAMIITAPFVKPFPAFAQTDEPTPEATAVVVEVPAVEIPADVPVVADDAVPQRAVDAHALAGHPFDHAVLDDVSRPGQPHAGALRECRAVAEDEAAHEHVVDALRMREGIDAEHQRPRRQLDRVRRRVRTVRERDAD